MDGPTESGALSARAASERRNPYSVCPVGKWWGALIMAMCAMSFSGCALFGLRKSVQTLHSHGVVAVAVSPVSATAPTYALALTKNIAGKNDMVGFQRVEADGVAVFLLLEGRGYNIGAFTDLNGDGKYEGGEPMDYIKNVHPAPLSDTKASTQPLALRLSTTNGLPAGQSIELPKENEELGADLAVTTGEIADLKSPKFSADVGEMGMWRPFEFLREHGVGVYFLEPYAPKKLPVLFVYGIGGSFQDWREVVEKIDRRKYQPWLFLYPTGVRLDKAANALAGSLILLKRRYGFDQMAVVAHSMGGLVARGAIQRAVSKAETNFIPEFISISTPWAGHEAAGWGVKHLNYPVPSWRDLTPGSTYLTDILEHPLPKGTRHDLIFTYKRSGGLGLPDENDGGVGLASELPEPVQAEAASVFGFHLSHEEILRSPKVVRRIEDHLPH